MRVLHIISGLGKGGAETMLLKLVGAQSRHQHEVVSLAGMGDLGEDFLRLGIPLQTLAFHQPARVASSFWRLRSMLRSAPDTAVVCWMNHGIFFGTLAHRSARLRTPLIWNVRQTLGNMQCETATTRAIIKLNGRLSHLADRIIYNSFAGAADHQAIGFDPAKRLIIGNGFAIDHFYPDPDAREAVRSELGIAPDDVVFGLVARFHAIKNHAGLIRAVEALSERHPSLRLLLVGLNAERDHASFRALFRDSRVLKRSITLGARSDIARLTRAIDVGCNVSFQEGFSNSIGEAMACAIPCMVTDVGDSAAIVGDTGLVCPNVSAEGISETMAEFLTMDAAKRRWLGRMARLRIEQHYGLSAIADQYDELFDGLSRSGHSAK